MTDRISRADEARLTHAIEKAASLAAVNDGLDRTELLAKTLQQSNIDSRFAKVASAAFNKRLTVNILSSKDDAHKADDFELADPEGVLDLMGGSTGVRKTAAYDPSTGAFMISFEAHSSAPVIRKTASLPSRPRYENAVDYNMFKDHLESVMDKCAAEFSGLNASCDKLDAVVGMEAEDLAVSLCKSASGSFDLENLIDMHGPELAALVLSRCSGKESMDKLASIRQQGNSHEAYAKADTLMKHAGWLGELRYFTGRFGVELSEFCKSAAFVGDAIAMAENRGLNKLSGFGGTLAANGLISAVNSATNIGGGMLEGAITGLGDIGSVAGSGFKSALNTIDATRKKSVSPYDFVDADFIVRDRASDKLMAWSDMTADPIISMYPSSQIFDAVNTAVAMDPTMGTPAKRELLRSYVSQLLAQNGRQSTADLAALGETVKNFNEAYEKGTKLDPLQKVKELEAKRSVSGSIGNILAEATGGTKITGAGLVRGALADANEALSKLPVMSLGDRLEILKNERKGQYKAKIKKAETTANEVATQVHNAMIDAQSSASIKGQIHKLNAMIKPYKDSKGHMHPAKIQSRTELIEWMKDPKNGGLAYWDTLLNAGGKTQLTGVLGKNKQPVTYNFEDFEARFKHFPDKKNNQQNQQSQQSQPDDVIRLADLIEAAKRGR